MILFVAADGVNVRSGITRTRPKTPATIVRRLSLPDRTGHLTLEIVFGETRYDLARKRTDSPFAFLERISAI
jgi:hypothetical protein